MTSAVIKTSNNLHQTDCTSCMHLQICIFSTVFGLTRIQEVQTFDSALNEPVRSVLSFRSDWQRILLTNAFNLASVSWRISLQKYPDKNSYCSCSQTWLVLLRCLSNSNRTSIHAEKMGSFDFGYSGATMNSRMYRKNISCFKKFCSTSKSMWMGVKTLGKNLSDLRWQEHFVHCTQSWKFGTNTRIVS